MSAEINTVIDNLCEKLGTAAGELAPAMAKYMVAKYSVYLAVSIIAFVFAAAFTVFALRRHIYLKSESKGIYYDDEWLVTFCISAIACAVILLAPVMINAVMLATWKAAPEGALINYIVENLK